MATEQQLYEQNELEKKRLNLSQQPIEEVQPIEERIVKLEQEQEVIITVLTDIMGV